MSSKHKAPEDIVHSTNKDKDNYINNSQLSFTSDNIKNVSYNLIKAIDILNDVAELLQSIDKTGDVNHIQHLDSLTESVFDALGETENCKRASIKLFNMLSGTPK